MNDHTVPHDDPDDLAALARELGTERVLGALADEHASAPPDHLRGELLQRVAAAPRRAVEAASPTALYRARAEALRDLLDGLTPEEWTLPATPYRWTVHGLIAHLLVIERYTAAQFGLDVDGEAVAHDPSVGHLEVGAELIADELASDPTATAARWWWTVDSLLAHLESDAYEPHRPVSLHEWPFSAESALVARSFEIWTHADDVRRAVGRPLDVPAAGELRTMSSLSVTSLPLVVPAVRPGTELPPLRVVLTGDGGGVYDLGPTETTAERLVSLDVVDYCRLAARRCDPDEVEIVIEGIADVVPAMWAAAQAFAV